MVTARACRGHQTTTAWSALRTASLPKTSKRRFPWFCLVAAIIFPTQNGWKIPPIIVTLPLLFASFGLDNLQLTLFSNWQRKVLFEGFCWWNLIMTQHFVLRKKKISEEKLAFELLQLFCLLSKLQNWQHQWLKMANTSRLKGCSSEADPWWWGWNTRNFGCASAAGCIFYCGQRKTHSSIHKLQTLFRLQISESAI